MTTRTEALGILAGTWEQKASWLRTHCADSVGARARAGAYAECAAALRALAAPSPGDHGGGDGREGT